MTSAMHQEIRDALGRLLVENCPAVIVREIEAGGDHRPLWTALDQSGFLDALVPETNGGAGLSLIEACVIAELGGRHALPVPMAETMVARGVLAQAGVQLPDGAIAIGHALHDPGQGLSCRQISFGRTADWVLAGGPAGWRLLRTCDAVACCDTSPIGAAMRWTNEAASAAECLELGETPTLAHAFAVAAALSGAMSAVLERTLDYANARQQFGKALGKFQAIQHQLSLMAEHLAAARMAVLTAASGVKFDPLRVAIAKARTNEAAVEVAAMSHAIHGAIGFTEEYDLQLFTRRLSLWRRTAGSESYWHERIGAWALAQEVRSLDLLRHVTDPHRGPTLS